MIADDLFAGAGGWELGGRALGIHGRGVENMKEARLTRDAAGLETIHDDVWTFVPDGKAEGLIASPPCQTFSLAGKGAGRKALDDVLSIIRRNEFIDMDTLRARAAELGDDRTGLVLTPLHFLVNYPNYRWAAWEQVPTVQPVWDACADKLRSWGWNVWTGRMQAEQYGVPQTRKRSILIASRDHEVGMPTPTHSKFHSRTPEKGDKGVLPWVSMAEALGWGVAKPPAPTVTGGGVETGGAEPIAKWHRYTGRSDFTPKGGGMTQPTHMVANDRLSHAALRRVEHPAPTVTAGHDSGNRKWLSATRSTRVTVQEAGVLQSFPGDHPWRGSKGKQFLQAGNAIPPRLAMHILAEAAGVNMREIEEERNAA